MSSKPLKTKNLEYLYNLSKGLNQNKKIEELKKELAKINAEGIFVAICNGALSAKTCYNDKLKRLVFSLQIRDFNVLWDWDLHPTCWDLHQTRPDLHPTEIVRSTDPILFDYFGQEYDPITVTELLKKCGLNEATCPQGNNYITFNFDAINMSKASECMGDLIEEKNNTLKLN